MSEMRAVVLTAIGLAKSSFQIETRPILVPQPEEILDRIKASGLKHSELATKLGEPNPMGDVPLSPVLGIDCVGVVESAADAEADLAPGTVVMAALSVMGRMFDGYYAEYCLVPRSCVIPVASSGKDLKLTWDVLGALPVLMQMAH